MGEDFIRCYIGDMSLTILEIVQRESGKFNEWELIDGTRFNLKQSYGYESIAKKHELLLEALAKHSVIAETRKPASVKPSIIWKNALNIADVITLLSLANARHYPTLAVEKNQDPKYSIGWGLISGDIVGTDIIPITDLGRFISEALTFIENNPSWLEESGFTPSIYWYEEAQKSYITAPSVLEMALYWVSMEIIAGVYIDSQGLDVRNKKERVKRFVTDKGYNGSTWDFLEEVIEDWYQTRCTLFHEGNQFLSFNILTKRRQQVRDFTSLVLVDALQQQNETNKTEIAKQMQSY